MPTSEEEVQNKAEEVQKLREKVADAEAQRVANEASLSNDLTMKQLEAEEAQLNARLAAAQASAKTSAVKQGVAAPMDAVKEQLQAGVTQQKSVEKEVKEASKSTSTRSGKDGK